MDVSLVPAVSLLCLIVGLTAATDSGAQDVYQAQEHGNITLTWLFPLKTDVPHASLYIHIMTLTLSRTIYLYDSKSEAELYQDELYKGRVWCNLELAKKGQLECLFIDLRLNDTDTYSSIFVVGEESHSGKRELNVTAARHQPVNETPEPAGRGRIGVYINAASFTVLTVVLAVRYYYFAQNIN